MCATLTTRSQQGQARIGGHGLLLREVEVRDVTCVMQGTGGDGAGLRRQKHRGTQLFHLFRRLRLGVRDAHVRDERDHGGSDARLLGRICLSCGTAARRSLQIVDEGQREPKLKNARAAAISAEAATTEHRVRQQARLHDVGLRDSEILECRLQSLVPKQRNTNGGIDGHDPVKRVGGVGHRH